MSPSSLTTARARTVFRVVAFAEALSWLGLLIGMFFKYVTDSGELGVQIFGPIHGVIFVAYVLVCLGVFRTFGWSAKVLLIALASSIPPFATAIFEMWADRRGLVGAPATRDGDRIQREPASLAD
ncbi:DUF3817 domain-containing protein [Barrientosiimonas endolithica]|uniref:Membrane protein n=1 Tax=Barrientosiimonas endolithica TaxID=1535208 RepID=A0ABN6YLD3_9MICO|nr:DUF3817 domain-containing protein [Barrientosiimonas endolithica]BDZ58180.1 membrane protein [Barrientosiimonas endolithica]